MGRRQRQGALGRRLLAAFLLVALASIGVLAAAALIGSDRGLAAARQAERDQAARRAAAAAAAAYTRAGGWTSADLGPVRAIVTAAGAGLFVLAADGTIVASPAGDATAGRPGMGHGPPGGERPGESAGRPEGRGIVTSPVTAGGSTVGSVRLAFGSPASVPGRGVAWSWIALAAAVAVAVAVAASWFVTRRISRPLVRLAGAARALAAGDRSARAGVSAPGELGELAGAFDRMAEDLTRAEGSRRRLAADVAHELRTPLAGLQAGLEELRDGLVDPDPARLAGLHDQALRLGRIVGDLAELSAAESAALSLHPADVDLGALAREAIAARRAQLDAAGIGVRAQVSDGVVVRADGDRVHQALGNLLANAARYCRPGDMVTVGVRADRGDAVIEVADTGPGVPAAERPYVFERMWRGAAGRRMGGSGIGLAVVRELVAAHGGTVALDSGDRGGTTVTIRLPVHARGGRPGP